MHGERVKKSKDLFLSLCCVSSDYYYVFINNACTWGGTVEQHFYIKRIQLIYAKGRPLSS
jgi:hypothetical protein